MVTDLEMNGVYRGAVEQFDLASNLRRDDVLFPECIRIFQTVDVDTQALFNRLRVVLSTFRWIYVTRCACQRHVRPS